MTIITHTITGPEWGSSASIIVPDGSPTYAQLRTERDNLLKENARLVEEVSRAQVHATENWAIVESIACGETIDCPRCNKPRPCTCQDKE